MTVSSRSMAVSILGLTILAEAYCLLDINNQTAILKPARYHWILKGLVDWCCSGEGWEGDSSVFEERAMTAPDSASNDFREEVSVKYSSSGIATVQCITINIHLSGYLMLIGNKTSQMALHP